MSENRNGDFEKKVNDMVDDLMKKVNDVAKEVVTRFDSEKEKAQIRSEIGHNSRDLTKAYEKLGRAYYESVSKGEPMEDMKDTMEMIRSKELLVKLLNEKLDNLDR
ncbi:MAG: hypothetical protein PUE44_01105 [Bulleidia sp.]|nr:hypothetical protein [Erysipelotrichaceae bacterium]MDD6662986.1 hypothetical protein [Bulleidia sp.]MDY4809512.1 hypothetical protein [Bulleidia sp.]HAW12943.1 hypothetical protein [Erysipelotrichaceae bacterium]